MNVHGVVFGRISELCHIRRPGLPKWFHPVPQAPYQRG